MNKDRGTIKWNAMMLPEHVKLLREWQQEDTYDVKPIVDEWTLHHINEQIQLAWERHCLIELTIWSPNGCDTVQHFIKKINLYEQYIELQNGVKMPFSSICDAAIID